MRDKTSEPRVRLLHPRVSDEVRNIIEQVELGFPPEIAVRVVEGFRSIEEQNALYRQGRTKPGPIVTKAKGGSSYHNYGLSIDFAILIDTDNSGTYDELSWDIRKDNDKDGIADWLEVVKVFENHGWEWGGRFHSIIDYPHLQKSFGLNWRELFYRYSKKDFIEGTHFVNLYKTTTL